MKNDEQHKSFFYFTSNLLGIMHPNISHCVPRNYSVENPEQYLLILLTKKKNQYPLVILSNKTYHVF